MRRVIWTRSAVSHVRDISAFIARDNKTAAISVAKRIDRAAHNLGRHSSGRPGRSPNTFEKLVTGLPYIIVYKMTDQDITIVRIIHTAQHYPPR